MANQGPGWSSYRAERRELKRATPLDKVLIVLFIAALGYAAGFLIGMRFSAGPHKRRGMEERQMTMAEQNRRVSNRVQVMAISCAIFAGVVGAAYIRQAGRNGVVDLSDMDRH